jgi:DNA-binding NarL/FixJ family response regulator
MVLDADPDSLASQYRMLTDRGFWVATFSAPSPACGYAAEEKPDAILTGVGFPEGDGLDVVRRLKEASPQSHILVMANPEQWPPLGEAARAGAEVLLSESQGSDALLRHLEDAIGELPVPVEH